MRTLVVDDSRLAAATMVRILAAIDPGGTCEALSSVPEMLDACERQPVDIIFLDIEMPQINGLEAARRLKVRFPQVKVVFVTGYPEYALDAWQTQASDFLVKPVNEQDVRRVLESPRMAVMQHESHGLYVQCFGNFEVFCDGEPVVFERKHTKELLAYLVDRRGALVSMGELMAVLWEDKPDTASRRSQLRTLIADLRRTFERLGYPHVVIKQRGAVAISLLPEECDYYSFVGGEPGSINSYCGEYMCQYSWAEPMAALLGEYNLQR